MEAFGEGESEALWREPRGYPWQSASDPLQVFKAFMAENPWLQKLWEGEFLRARPMLGVPNGKSLAALAEAWFRRAWNHKQRQIHTWTDDQIQTYVFNAIVRSLPTTGLGGVDLR